MELQRSYLQFGVLWFGHRRKREWKIFFFPQVSFHLFLFEFLHFSYHNTSDLISNIFIMMDCRIYTALQELFSRAHHAIWSMV